MIAIGVALLPSPQQAAAEPAELTAECGGEFVREGVCELLFSGFPLVIEGLYETDSGEEWVDVHVEMVIRVGPVHIAPYLECEEESAGRVECSAEFGPEAGLPPVPSVPGLYEVTCWAHTHTRVEGNGWYRCASGP